MRIDMHCHYTLSARPATLPERFSFEPASAAGRPAWDSYVAPAIAGSFSWGVLRRLLGLPTRLPPGPELDRELEAMYDRHLSAAGPIDRYVLLAFDEYHTALGERPPPQQRRSQRGSDMYTSNTLIRALCRARPERFLFGASVHPYRRAAPECVAEVFAGGACLLKWIPLHQNIDPRDPRTIAVLETCARLGLPLLIHASGEFTLRTQHPEFRPVSAWLGVLRELRRRDRMPAVIIAHVATPVFAWFERRELASFLAALRGEFRDAPLYADVSALTAWAKLAFLRRFAAAQDLHGKFLFGSDFPVPLGRPMLDWQLSPGGRALLRRQASWPQQAALAMQDRGFGEIVFRRAAHVLPNVGYFAAPPSGSASPAARAAGGAGG